MRTRRSQSSGDPVPSGNEGHRSVLLHEAIDSLAIRAGDVAVDATLGGAGHAREIEARLGKEGVLIGFDLDADAIARAATALQGARPAVHLVEANFRYLEAELKKLGVGEIDKALFDLGWSSFQLDAGRGFSFLRDEPLGMTYAKEGGALTAERIVNTWGEESIADIIFGWGEERYARRIARRIVDERQKSPITTALRLADIVKAAVPASYRRGKIHPATKTFQALRIAVNDELGSLKEGILAAWKLLAPGGRIAVITFHSIEDREVKRLFAGLKAKGGMPVTKKVIKPSAGELQKNPRARTAKLRCIEKHDKTISHKQTETLGAPRPS